MTKPATDRIPTERKQWSAPTLKVLPTQQTEGAQFTEVMEGAAKKAGS